MENDTVTFGITDYVVFSLMLVCSAAIGIYYRFTGGKQKTSEEFLLANRSMPILPVGFSLMASFMSAITLLGVASENYSYGTQFVIINIAYIIGTPVAAYLFLPVFFQMEITSAFEYLEHRFGKITRVVGSITFILQTTLYMAIVVYAPALALSAVTGIPKWSSIISIGAVCTFYCTLGGIKAVLWTDVFQSILMFSAIFAVIIKGTMNVGGLHNVWKIADEGGRIEFFNFDPNPTVRHTVWTLAIGGIFLYVSIYGVNQTQVQRLLTVKNVKKAQQALFLNWPITTLLSLATSFAGLVMYANIHNCDPLATGEIAMSDQLLPYFVMKSLGHLPGLPGLFVAGIFSGALSTMSSAVNSLAAVTLEDFIKPFYYKNEVPEKKAAFISTILALLYGLLCVLLTYVTSLLGGVLQASLTIFGVVGGPVLGLFSLGMFCRRGNQVGALIGLISSLVICLWLGFATNASGYKAPTLPVNTDECQAVTAFNTTVSSLSNVTIAYFNNTFTTAPPLQSSVKDSDVFVLYKISYMWYSGIGWLLAFVIGFLASILSGGNDDVDPSLLNPLVNCGGRRTLSITHNNELYMNVLGRETGDSAETHKLTEAEDKLLNKMRENHQDV